MTSPPDLPTIDAPPLVVERDDGQFQIGLDAESALGPFETRDFAEAVRLRMTRHDPERCRL
jgi:hypothetical protein